MRNSERRPIQIGVDDAGISLLLTETRKDERRNRAEVMAARMELIAVHILRRDLTPPQISLLLCSEAERIRNEAQEIS